MKKHVGRAVATVDDEQWRTLGEDVEVELTSEHPDFPIESALLGHDGGGWRANDPAPQTIRLSWPSPITLRRIRLVFEEHEHARTQEFVLRAQTRHGACDIVRQQFTFSPPGTTDEREDYAVRLDGVTQLELVIIPSIGSHSAVASLREWRVA